MRKKSHKKPEKRARIKTKRATLSAVDLQNVLKLAQQLGELLPLSGYRSKFSLTVLAKEWGLKKYLGNATSKKDVYAEFITGMLRDNKRITLKKFVRENLPKAIERRHGNGNPLLKPEADELVVTLLALGVDLKKEIEALQLPVDRPKTVPPPPEVKKALDALGLHPMLLPECRTLFVDGHINESVRKAAEKFETIVQKVSGLASRQGKELMGEAFSEKSPIVRLNALTSSSDMNEQEGYRLIAMGVMVWWRNTLSHGDEQTIPHHEALGRLGMISNLLHRLDSRAT